MRKAIAVVLATAIAVSVAMIGCSKDGKKDDSTSTTIDGLIGNEDTYEIVDEEVTDEKGETVTDKNGNAVTTQVMYKETTDKKGNKITVKVDDNGEVVTDKKHKPVTVATTKGNSSIKPTVQSTSDEPTSEVTTVPVDEDVVPKIDDKTKPAEFNNSEKEVVESMLSVPNLCNSNYENADGVPLDAARHAAVWMAQREELNTKTYASGTIVLGLFKFFGQTVVNFKNNCGSTKEIKYNADNDTFTIPNAESTVQTVTVDKVEEYAQKNNNNYYKVTASVSGGGKTKVVAVVQKNKLDNKLGFSIKAMRWS
ncbi:hypothetical protein [Eubacterium sp.]